jgi:hypothetical protein
VLTSNQASAINSVPAAIAVKAAYLLRVCSRYAVSPAAIAVPQSRPIQATFQWSAWYVLGRVTARIRHQGSSTVATPAATSVARPPGDRRGRILPSSRPSAM